MNDHVRAPRAVSVTFPLDTLPSRKVVEKHHHNNYCHDRILTARSALNPRECLRSLQSEVPESPLPTNSRAESLLLSETDPK